MFNPGQLKLIIDSIVWAFRHTERNVAETGLNLLRVSVFAHTLLCRNEDCLSGGLCIHLANAMSYVCDLALVGWVTILLQCCFVVYLVTPCEIRCIMYVCTCVCALTGPALSVQYQSVRNTVLPDVLPPVVARDLRSHDRCA